MKKFIAFSILTAYLLTSLFTFHSSATALMPVMGTAVEDAFVSDIIANMLMQGMEFDFSQSGLVFNDYDTFADYLMEFISNPLGTCFEVMETGLVNMYNGMRDVHVGYAPVQHYGGNFLRNFASSISVEGETVHEPVADVSDAERTLASMILNRSLYVNTYGEYLNNLPSSPFFWSISGSWYYYMTAEYPLRLFYNTTSRNVALYRYYNNAWEIYSAITYYPGLTYYGNFNMGNTVYSALPHVAQKQPTFGSYSSNGSYENKFNTGSYNTRNVSLLTALTTCVGNFSGVPFYVGSSFADSLPIIPQLSSTPSFNVGGAEIIDSPFGEIPQVYILPPDSYFDYKALKIIIDNAIKNSGLLKFDDIKNVFVDVNGQQVIATLQIVRTDYDNLVHEQYLDVQPLPNFVANEYVNALVADVSVGADVVNSGVMVMPEQLKYPLFGAGIIILAAYFLKRLLE